MEVATLWGEKNSTIIIFKEYDPISLQIRGGILHFTIQNGDCIHRIAKSDTFYLILL